MMNSFKEDTYFNARRVHSSKVKKIQQWKGSLLNAYEGLAAATCASDVTDLLECPLPQMDATLLGLEKWVLRPVAHDRAIRRKQLIHATRSNNEDTTSSLSHKNKILRKVSRELSRPARLFAHHLALIAACEDQWKCKTRPAI